MAGSNNNKTLIIEGRVDLCNFASLMLYYTKKGIDFRSRSEAVAFIVNTQLEALKINNPDVKILSDEESIMYLGIKVGGKGLFSRQRAAAAFALENLACETGTLSPSMQRNEEIKASANSNASKEHSKLSLEEIDQLIKDANMQTA